MLRIPRNPFILLSPNAVLANAGTGEPLLPGGDALLLSFKRC